MANDLNLCQFIGRLGADPEVTYMANGTAVAKIRFACGRKWKDKQTNDMREETEWIRAAAFGKLAEIIGEYTHKGDQLYLAGRFHTSEYEKGGEKRYSTEIILETMQMLGGKSDRTQGGSGSPRQGDATPELDDDIPFITRDGVK